MAARKLGYRPGSSFTSYSGADDTRTLQLAHRVGLNLRLIRSDGDQGDITRQVFRARRRPG